MTEDNAHSRPLIADGLWKRYQDRSLVLRGRKTVEALKGVSFSIPPRSAVGLVGESGSGKSTLARCLSGLERPDSGEITFGGLALSSFDCAAIRAYRRSVQLVLQDSSLALNPRFTIEEVLLEPLVVGNVPRALRGRYVASILDRVGLPASWKRRVPAQLSGGQRQRIAIGRALLCNPAILILDESLSGLDPQTQAQVIELVSSLHEEQGFSYLLISHDVRLARHMTSCTVVMHRGTIVEAGPAVEVLSDPKHAYTRLLLEALPKMPDII